ncbi:MAG: helix-turn-helix domain-containing protein [Acidimicrobiia bacterium]|nr:helix-turn-helix domain-containing protein [Acidimicrobiia bacterium]
MTVTSTASPFGIHLRQWRTLRGLSQLDLAGRAESTPRHISFLETGRSRPRRATVLKLGDALDLPPRECNELLGAAGLAPEFSEFGLADEALGAYRTAIDALLSSHEPYPACVIDRWGSVVLSNDAFERFSPGLSDMTPEQLIEATFGSEEGRAWVENWQDLAWAYVDRVSTLAARSADDRLLTLVDKVRSYLAGAPRPETTANPHVVARLRMGDTTLSTFTTFLRFENAHDVTLSEATVELIFPANDATKAFFEAR